MESPSKRSRLSEPGADFVSLAVDENLAGDKYGFSNAGKNEQQQSRSYNPKHDRRVLQDRRHALDRPKSKKALPGHEPWVLVMTKFGRKFVHNTKTKTSLWRIPDELIQAIDELDVHERDQQEKVANARWAEEQLKEMRLKPVSKSAGEELEDSARETRRRSESLQREDEAALMAELAQDNGREKAISDYIPPPRVGDTGYDSDGDSYEYVEVTDSEGEEQENAVGQKVTAEDNSVDKNGGDQEEQDEPSDRDVSEEPDGPVEFGEDDIALQLAAMGEEYGLDPGEYGENDQGDWEEGAEGEAFTEEDAINLFRDLLEDAGLSPFTPWDQIVADISPASIVHDGRYTVLPNMKARKEAWDDWTKLKIVQIKEQRAKMEKSDPKIPYLAFLSSKATPKLYWPEFKRKYKREPELNDRNLSDKDREKLYREHITRVKLPESTRKADLLSLIGNVPLRDLHRGSTVDALPSQIQSHLHFISLPTEVREKVISSYIRSLPALDEANAADEMTSEERTAAEKKRLDRRKREAALVAREKAVAEDKRKAERAERLARRDLVNGERELQRAMEVGRAGLRANIAES